MKGEKESFEILIITDTQYKYDFDSFGPLEL